MPFCLQHCCSTHVSRVNDLQMQCQVCFWECETLDCQAWPKIWGSMLNVHIFTLIHHLLSELTYDSMMNCTNITCVCLPIGLVEGFIGLSLFLCFFGWLQGTKGMPLVYSNWPDLSLVDEQSGWLQCPFEGFQWLQATTKATAPHWVIFFPIF